MARLYGGDERPTVGRIEWYVERTQRCLALIWELAEEVLLAGTNVVLEVGLIQRRERMEFVERIDDAKCDFTLYVVDAPRDVRRARVQQRNRERGETFSVEVPPEFFELASDLWEAPGEEECRGRDVRFLGS
jgi:hypothetical protein